MPEPEPIDYEALRKRFPWVGLARTAETDLAGRYRDIMARARTDREALDALDAVVKIRYVAADNIAPEHH